MSWFFTCYFFFFNDTATTEIYTLSLHDALPISDIEAERKKRDEIEAGKSYCSRRFGGATCDDKSAQYLRSEERFSRNAETDIVCRLLLEKKKKRYESVTNSMSPTKQCRAVIECA